MSFVERVTRSSEVQNVLIIWENEHLGLLNVSFIERLFLLCPLLGGSFIRGSSTVLLLIYVNISHMQFQEYFRGMLTYFKNGLQIL